MSDRYLLQVWVDPTTHERVNAVKRGYRLDNAELMRTALEELLTRLEAHPAPFADTPETH